MGVGQNLLLHSRCRTKDQWQSKKICIAKSWKTRGWFYYWRGKMGMIQEQMLMKHPGQALVLSSRICLTKDNEKLKVTMSQVAWTSFMSVGEFDHSRRVPASVLSFNDAHVFIGRVWCLLNCESMVSSQEMGSENVSPSLRDQSLWLESNHSLSDYRKQILNSQEAVIDFLPCHTHIEHRRMAPLKS